MADKLVLIDGHSILNRAYYGIPPLTNAAGLHINAIYGFLNIMFKILEEEQPEFLAVAFDVSAPTFRHEIYKGYKDTRKQMDPELEEQVPVMKEVLQAMGVMIMEQAGLEADDILGTMAKSAKKKGMEVSLVSGDRDLLQIASDHIKIRIPKIKGGKTEVKDYYAKDVIAEYQVDPLQFIDLKALMGDASDNIPGVPKIGQKTAEKLIVEYGSLDQIYEHVEEISMKAVRESLIEHKDLADLSKVLATINISAELSYQWEDARIGNLYTKQALKKFEELGLQEQEMNSLFYEMEIPLSDVLYRMENTVSDIKKNRRVLPDGTKITTYSREIVNLNLLDVEAGTTGYQGGDSGHGGRTYFRIADAGSTDIQVKPLGRYADKGFEVILGGDCELETMILALKFITQVLEKEATATATRKNE